MNGLRCAVLLMCLAFVQFAGCCCVPTNQSCGLGCASPCSTGCCDDGAPRHPGLFDCDCGGGGCSSCSGNVLGKLASHKSCKGACGEVYVDEWINEPPVADHCGYSCGGCGQCGQCRPLFSTLKRLWGRPYHTCCPSPFQCGGSCGCDSCGTGNTWVSDSYVPSHGSGGSCNCGSSHESYVSPVPSQPQPMVAPELVPQSTAPEAPFEQVTPTPVPDPASDPSVTPSSARRLNPARNKRGVRYASSRRP